MMDDRNRMAITKRNRHDANVRFFLLPCDVKGVLVRTWYGTTAGMFIKYVLVRTTVRTESSNIIYSSLNPSLQTYDRSELMAIAAKSSKAAHFSFWYENERKITGSLSSSDCSASSCNIPLFSSWCQSATNTYLRLLTF